MHVAFVEVIEWLLTLTAPVMTVWCSGPDDASTR